MIPMSITLLYSEFPPEERGTALGALGLPLLVAPTLGPTVGGYIVTFVDWRVLFYINVPIGILGVLVASILLHESRPEGGHYFDVPGFLCSSVGLASLLYAFSSAGTDGWSSSTVFTFLVIGLGKKRNVDNFPPACYPRLTIKGSCTCRASMRCCWR